MRGLGFGCSCSRERVERVLVSLGEEESRAALDAEGQVVVRCEFCGADYRFDGTALAGLFADGRQPPAAGAGG
jgi:molecular chaperone Hsp33